jgi:hypothetical protein
MATFNLSANGVQGLTPGTKILFVHVTAFPTNYGQGRATPPNYFDIGLLRVSYQGAVYKTQPIDARDMIIELPQHADALGYSIFTPATVQVTEA